MYVRVSLTREAVHVGGEVCDVSVVTMVALGNGEKVASGVQDTVYWKVNFLFTLY